MASDHHIYRHRNQGGEPIPRDVMTSRSHDDRDDDGGEEEEKLFEVVAAVPVVIRAVVVMVEDGQIDCSSRGVLIVQGNSKELKAAIHKNEKTKVLLKRLKGYSR